MSVVLNSFASGLNNRIDPTLLSADSAEEFHNADNSSGVIKSLKKPKLNNLIADIGAEESFFLKNFLGRDDSSKLKIHKDSPTVLYDRWLFHRDADGKMRVSQWRGDESERNFYKNRLVGLDVFGDFSLENTVSDQNTIINNTYTPEKNDFQFTFWPSTAGIDTVIRGDATVKLKFVILDEFNNNIFVKDYTFTPEELEINTVGFSGYNRNYRINQIYLHYSGNFRLYVKVEDSEENSSYFLTGFKLQDQNYASAVYNWLRNKSQAITNRETYMGLTTSANTPHNFGYQIVEIFTKNGGAPSDDNPIIYRSNPSLVKYVESVTTFSRTVNISIGNVADRYFEVYRTDNINVIPYRIGTIKRTGSSPNYVFTSEISNFITGIADTVVKDTTGLISNHYYVFSDSEGNRIWCNNVNDIINNSVITQEKVDEIPKNCWRKVFRTNINTGEPIIDINSPAIFNEGDKVKFVKIPKGVDSSFILTTYDHDSPNDNNTYNYNDNGNIVSEVNDNLLVKNNTGQKPSLIEAYGRLWASSGRFVRFSKPGEPEYWPRQNSLSFNDNITGLLQVSNGILVFTADETYLIVGTSLNDFAITLVTKEQGCIAPRSCGYLQSAPVWLCNDGIASYEGGVVRVLSRNAIHQETIDKITKGFICAEVHDEQYFILYTNDLGGNNTSILVMDVRYGVSFYTIDGGIRVDGLTSIEVNIRDLRMYEDTLYAVGTDNKIYEMFASDAEADSEKYYTIKYRTPVLTLGSGSQLKEVESIWVSMKDVDNLQVKYLEDRKPVQTLTTHTTENDRTPAEEFRMPIQGSRFNELQFEFEGIVKGYIREISVLTKVEDQKWSGFLGPGR